MDVPVGTSDQVWPGRCGDKSSGSRRGAHAKPAIATIRNVEPGSLAL